MPLQTFQRLRVEAAISDFWLHEPKEVPRQRCDVVWTCAQRRDLDDEAVDSVVQVRAEAALAHHGPQIPVRRAHEANVDSARRFAAHPTNVPGLQNAKEPRLKSRRQLGDLVQEQRPSMRLLERAAMSLHRTGERTPRVPEELALNQFAWKPTAVEGDERTFVPRPLLVKPTGDVLLANPRFASNQNRPRQLRESIDLGHDG